MEGLENVRKALDSKLICEHSAFANADEIEEILHCIFAEIINCLDLRFILTLKHTFSAAGILFDAVVPILMVELEN